MAEKRSIKTLKSMLQVERNLFTFEKGENENRPYITRSQIGPPKVLKNGGLF